MIYITGSPPEAKGRQLIVEEIFLYRASVPGGTGGNPAVIQALITDRNWIHTIMGSNEIIELQADGTFIGKEDVGSSIRCMAHGDGTTAIAQKGQAIVHFPFTVKNNPKIDLSAKGMSSISRIIPGLDGAGTFRVFGANGITKSIRPADSTIRDLERSQAVSTDEISGPLVQISDDTLIRYGCGYIGLTSMFRVGPNQFLLGHTSEQSRYAICSTADKLLIIDKKDSTFWNESLSHISCMTVIGQDTFLIGTNDGRLLRARVSDEHGSGLIGIDCPDSEPESVDSVVDHIHGGKQDEKNQD